MVGVLQLLFVARSLYFLIVLWFQREDMYYFLMNIKSIVWVVGLVGSSACCISLKT